MGRDSNDMIKEVGSSLLAEGKTLKIKADGYSMFPAIRPGNTVYIEPLTGERDPEPGEIIAWKRDTGFIVHRLVKIIREENKVCFITRGDSCANEDNPIVKDQIAGKVVRTEAASGKRNKSGYKLIIKPNYLYNRLLVWFVVRFKRLRNFVIRF
jgi:signal peptidase I